MATFILQDMRCQLAAVAPTSATAGEMMFPTYNLAMMESVLPMAKYFTVKADSGLTYAHLPGVSRKRSREDGNNTINMNQFVPTENLNSYRNHCSTGSFGFLGEDFCSQIQHDQLEVDQIIAHHMEKVRLEMEERKRNYSRRIMAAVEESISKKLKAKEEEISKIEKLNLSLVDRVKSLYVETQLWRDLAQTNETTATALRNNLEQVLAQVQDVHHQRRYIIEGGTEGLNDDVQSCNGSNYDEDVERRSLAENAVVESRRSVADGDVKKNKVCMSCGKYEASVLVLPCRHLCLCTGCDSYLGICPVCKSSKSCSLHVNLST